MNLPDSLPRFKHHIFHNIFSPGISRGIFIYNFPISTTQVHLTSMLFSMPRKTLQKEHLMWLKTNCIPAALFTRILAHPHKKNYFKSHVHPKTRLREMRVFPCLIDWLAGKRCENAGNNRFVARQRPLNKLESINQFDWFACASFCRGFLCDTRVIE